jgi:tetratricopeptide (TPR) repeat protein
MAQARYRLRVLAAAILLLAAASCSRNSSNPTSRIAILAIDNLSGDPALDWISNAAPRILASQLTGAPGAPPLLASSVTDAYAAGATRLLYGYFDQRDQRGSAQSPPAAKLHFEFRLEDAASHHLQESIALDAPPALVLDTLAHRIDPAAHAYSSSDPQAIEAFGRGEYDRAVELDPAFSAAWLAWADSLAIADPARASGITARALQQSNLRSPIDRSRLQLLAATLTHDPEAELTALEGLVAQTPSDPNAARSLAETAMNARKFTRAAKYYQALQALTPADVNVQNLTGYAYAFAGDLDSALKAFEAYRRQPGQEPNALDSIGEAYFVNGRFTDAERYFLQAHDKDPAMLGGGDLLKAAYASFLAGKPADELFYRFTQAREQAQDPLLPWKKAIWQYTTGHPNQAQATLESALPAASPQLAELARKQLAVWKTPPQIPTDLQALKRAYESIPPTADGLARTFYAAALLQQGQKEEATKLLTRWPLPDSAGDPVLQAFLYPKFQELRRQTVDQTY